MENELSIRILQNEIKSRNYELCIYLDSFMTYSKAKRIQVSKRSVRLKSEIDKIQQAINSIKD